MYCYHNYLCSQKMKKGWSHDAEGKRFFEWLNEKNVIVKKQEKYKY